MHLADLARSFGGSLDVASGALQQGPATCVERRKPRSPGGGERGLVGSESARVRMERRGPGYGVQPLWLGQMPPVFTSYCQPELPSPAAPVPAATVLRSLNGLVGSSPST